MTVFGRKSDPFQQSTCQQLPADRGDYPLLICLANPNGPSEARVPNRAGNRTTLGQAIKDAATGAATPTRYDPNKNFSELLDTLCK